MTGLDITLIIAACYVGVGFGVALSCGLDNNDHPVGKGCVWPLYLVVEATKAVFELIQEFKKVWNEMQNSK